MSIEKNIDSVVATFQLGRHVAESGIPMEELLCKLKTFEPRYRSVAFEGASMGIALTHGLDTWNTFAQHAQRHATQVHIGLGWAMAEGQWDIASTLSAIEPEMRVKVLDGHGYWHGLFQRRATIRMQQVPQPITPDHRSGFDQGVGRAIWYITKGEPAKVLNIIDHFPESRRADLWQGIGVALTYVGGCSAERLRKIRSVSGDHRSNVDTGIASAEGSMRLALSENSF